MTALQTQTKTTGAKRLEGKVAIVTGGARGIGAAIAKKLGAEGATVVVNYVNSKDAAAKVVEAIKESGAKALAVQANVTKQDDSKRLIDEVVKAYGKIDILVNNAGVSSARPIDQVDIAHYDEIFDVNVKGVVATTIAALPHFNDGGRIINISSGVAEVTVPGFSIYSATKAALNTLTRIWAQDLGARHITVNGVAPGATATDMLESAMPQEARAHMVSKTALGRLGEPADIADVVAFVASDDARWITGQTIRADGGINI